MPPLGVKQTAPPSGNISGGRAVCEPLGNPAGREAAWRFFTRNWTRIRRRIPPLMVSRLVEATPALREPRFAREVGRFFRAHPVAEARRSLKQALEIFRLNAELRRRITPGIERWLNP